MSIQKRTFETPSLSSGWPDRGRISDPQTQDMEWVPLRGGELEARPPKALCPDCRERLRSGWVRPPFSALCFQCYRAGVAREQILREAGRLDTATEARFQVSRPFEPLNRPRLGRLQADRQAACVARQSGAGRFEAARRSAQIAARHALQQAALGPARRKIPKELNRATASALHGGKVRLPESWLPFVVSQ